MDRRRRLGLAAIVVAVAALCASVSLWIIFEQDIFWQVRAGAELLRTHAFPWKDTWSYSAHGEPWLNIQWLSTIALYLGYVAGSTPHDDVAGLIYMRGACVALLFMLLGAVVTASARRALICAEQAPAQWPGLPAPTWPFVNCASVVMTCLPCLYTVLLPRLQLRSDLFVMMTFALLVWVWQTVDPTVPKRLSHGLWASVISVWLAANLHAGTAPFVLVLALAYTFSYARSLRVACSYCAMCVGAFFATPYTWHVLPTLYEHLLYARYNLLRNTDQLPLTWGYFVPHASTWGWSGVAWVALCAAAIASVLLRALAQGRMGRQLVRRMVWPRVGAFVVFSAMCINRERSIPYHAIFVLPFAAALLVRVPRGVVAGAALCAWLGWYSSAMSLAPVRGGGVHEGLYPVGCAKFVERAQPQGNVFHTFALGAYLAWYMRDRPLYVDTRETMYRPLQSEVIGSFSSPQITQLLLRKYAAHTVMMPIPPTQFVPGQGFEDVIARFLPNDRWALVYFDKAAFVSVERIAAHEQLIADYEYMYLRPNLPANLYAASADREPRRDAAFLAEVQRCLHDEPDNIYCTVAQAAMQRDTPAPFAARQQTVARLQAAVRLAERWNSAQWPHAMVELHRAYEDVGDVAGARAIEARLPLWGAAARQGLTGPSGRPGSMPAAQAAP